MFTHEILVFSGHSEYHVSCEIITIVTDKNRQKTDLVYLEILPKATIIQAARSNEAQTAASVSHKEGNRHFPSCHLLFRVFVCTLFDWLAVLLV